MTDREQVEECVTRKVLQGSPIFAMFLTLCVEWGALWYFDPPKGAWAILLFVPPLAVAFAIDRRLRKTDWYPYAVEDLEPAESACPLCRSSEDYYREPGLVPVNRCLNCDSEGVSIRDKFRS